MAPPPQGKSPAALASKYRLALHEVKPIVAEFEKAKRNANGGFDYADFHKIILGMLSVPSTNEEIVMKIYKATDMQSSGDIDAFLGWWVQNMFAYSAQLTAEGGVDEGKEEVGPLAL